MGVMDGGEIKLVENKVIVIRVRATGIKITTKLGWCMPECDIRENFDTNECPNIFVSTKLHE